MDGVYWRYESENIKIWKYESLFAYMIYCSNFMQKSFFIYWKENEIDI